MELNYIFSAKLGSVSLLALLMALVAILIDTISNVKGYLEVRRTNKSSSKQYLRGDIFGRITRFLIISVPLIGALFGSLLFFVLLVLFVIHRANNSIKSFVRGFQASTNGISTSKKQILASGIGALLIVAIYVIPLVLYYILIFD